MPPCSHAQGAQHTQPRSIPAAAPWRGHHSPHCTDGLAGAWGWGWGAGRLCGWGCQARILTLSLVGLTHGLSELRVLSSVTQATKSTVTLQGPGQLTGPPSHP